MSKTTELPVHGGSDTLRSGPIGPARDMETLSRRVWDSMRPENRLAGQTLNEDASKPQGHGDLKLTEGGHSGNKAHDDFYIPDIDEPIKGTEPRKDKSPPSGELKILPSDEFPGLKPRSDSQSLKHNDAPAEKTSAVRETPARIQEFHQLKNRSADHGGTPDAVLRIPPNFDASKPFNMVVYNHGFYSTAGSSIPYNNLDKLMANAPPNTILVLPEWQVNPSAASGAQGRFGDQNRFRNMIQEIFDKTPELKGRTVGDIANIDIFSHSAGYNAARSELYNNDLGGKVRTVVDLDSQYSPRVYDGWIRENIGDISRGNKRFYSIGEDRRAATEALSNRVSRMLKNSGLPDDSLRDYNHPKSTPGSQTFKDHSLVFKHSTATLHGRGPHMSIPELYFGKILESLR
ncbi:MAG: hypothetical protein KC777_17215 [Cyanobacteria bacterium HKST-UBA02]|nr:hypothetical protein [Cyanobacteria bacterium HKST-UBA02]